MTGGWDKNWGVVPIEAAVAQCMECQQRGS